MRFFRALEPLARAPASARPPDLRCELCTARLPERHPHVVDLTDRSLNCACAPCALLFRDSAAGGGRFRTVPSRVLRQAGPTDHRSDEPGWTALEVPVSLAFFFFSSASERWVACYPSPAGPTEAEVDEEALAGLSCRALIEALEPDVEALLMHRPRGGGGDCLLVPIDACYALAGIVRLHWEGFDGGDRARQAIDEFIGGLKARARTLGRTTPLDSMPGDDS